MLDFLFPFISMVPLYTAIITAARIKYACFSTTIQLSHATMSLSNFFNLEAAKF